MRVKYQGFVFYRQTCCAMKPEPTTDRDGKGRGLTNKLFPQCGAFSRDLLDGMSKTPAIPGQGPCLYMTCAFLR